VEGAVSKIRARKRLAADLRVVEGRRVGVESREVHTNQMIVSLLPTEGYE